MSLRVVQIDGEPWFSAKDTCNALSLRGFPSQFTSRLAPDERMVLEKTRIQDGGLLELFPGTTARVPLISESGLYKLITRSDKPAAKPFQEWVTRDVLPSIRKTGSYSLTDGVEASRVVAGEIVQNNNAGAIESEFKAIVSTRANRRVQQIAALKAELHELETAQVISFNFIFTTKF
nr:BRO family protein [Aliiroseovarius sp. S2029]